MRNLCSVQNVHQNTTAPPVSVRLRSGDGMGKLGGLVEAAAKPCCVVLSVAACLAACTPSVAPGRFYDLYPLALVALLRSSAEQHFPVIPSLTSADFHLELRLVFYILFF